MALKIKRFKDWYQVVNELGYTVEQFKSRMMAEDYCRITYRSQEPVLQRVSQHFGQTIRHISIYP